MIIKKHGLYLEIENLFIIILISFFFSGKIKLFLTSYFVCYLFILFHELAHILIATLFGKKIKKIKLSIAGVCVTFNNVELKKVKDIIIYIAGPMSNLILASIFFNIDMVFQINMFLAMLNLMPIYPLDGYNIIKLLWSEKLLQGLQYVFFSLLFLLSFFILIMEKNPSLLIFFIYVILIQYASKNHVK